MYLDHFNMHRFPFPNAADIDHFFEHGKRKVTLKAIEYAMCHEEGLTTVVGEIGVGKSTILRLLVKTISTTLDTVVIDDPRMMPIDFLKAIAFQLNINVPQSNNIQDLRTILNNHLYQKHMEQQRVVVVIDEVQYISSEVLEEIHMLSNLENNEKRLVQWVLFGQPQMEENLMGKAASPLRDRIINRICVEQLSLKEIDSYIKFRLNVAGYKGPKIFSLSAIQLIEAISCGSIRKIHVLAHKSLLAAFSMNARQVGPHHVKLGNQENIDYFQSLNRRRVGKPGVELDNRIFKEIFHFIKKVLTPGNSPRYVNMVFVPIFLIVVVGWINSGEILAAATLKKIPKQLETIFYLGEDFAKKDIIADYDEANKEESQRYNSEILQKKVSVKTIRKQTATQHLSKKGDVVNGKIQELLHRANINYRASRLISPKGQNALENLKTVLELEPNNIIARQGLRSVAQKLNDLATKDIEAWRLSKPQGHNALSKLNAVLEFQPNNEEAQQGLNEVVDRYIRLAYKYYYDHDRSRHYLVKAESIIPDDPRILKASSRIYLMAKYPRRK
ncbi:MAG: AAA family ATPase [Magnetococcales bacterium]|nr:AAA family ATPase [Magnetococcales bacterium]